jgi:amidase
MLWPSPSAALISRQVIRSANQDTAGPLARTVTDAAILLGAMTGVDPHDPATSNCPTISDYRPFLDPDALSGARIGIPRAFYFDRFTPPGASSPMGGLTPEQAAVMSEAIEILEQQGAIIVDPADIPSVVDSNSDNNLVLWGICAGADQAKGFDSACSVVLKFGFKRDFNLWLESLGPDRPVGTLTDLRDFNIAHTAENAIKYGRETSPSPLQLRLHVLRSRPELQIEVSNSGHWIETDKNRTSGGVGLENLQRRLVLLYPGQHRMEITRKEDSVSVRICIPAK